MQEGVVSKNKKIKPFVYFGFIFFGLYWLVAYTVNTVFYEDVAFISLTFVLFVIYIGYFLLFHFFNSRPPEVPKFRAILLFSALFSTVLTLAVPYAGSDFFHYFFEDVALVKYHQNPYFTAPKDIPNDPASIVSYWKFLPSQHGPLRVYLLSPLAFISGGGIVVGVFLYKFIFSLFFLGSVWLVYKILKIFNEPWAPLGTLLFAWNPLLLYDTHLFGGTDIILVFWLLAAVYAAAKKKFYFSVLFLTCSVLVKYVTILFLPFFIVYYTTQYKNFWRQVWVGLKYVFVFGLTTVVLFAPFWRGLNLDTLAGVRWVSSVFDINSFPGFIYISLLLTNLSITTDQIRLIFELTFGTVYLGLLGWFYFKEKTFTFLLQALFLVLAAFLLLAKFWFYDKYLIWLLPLVFLLGKKTSLVGIFLTGMVVLGPSDYGSMVLALVPPALIFSFYYYMMDFIRPKV